MTPHTVSSRIVTLLLLCTDVMCLIDTHSRRSLITNTCHVAQDDCKYTLTLNPSQSACHLEGAPLYQHTNKRTVTTTNNVTTLKRLDQLEQKLVRLIEDLSVRSLRQIRHIRVNLKQLSEEVRNFRKSSKNATSQLFESPPTTDQCLPEFSRVGSWRSCYRFSLFNATWHEAREYCSAFGANLLAVDSLKEAHIVDYLIKSHSDFEEVDRWWTSGNYMLRNQRWMWTSKHHLKPMTYTRWAAAGAASSPSNNVTSSPPSPGGTLTTVMNCMLLHKPDKYLWTVAPCTERNNFICEMDL